MKKIDKNFLKTLKTFEISKYSKIWVSIPILIVTITMILVIALGATSGSYTNAIGIGIDFEGGTMLTVTLGEEALNKYDENVAKIKKSIEEKGVTVSYIQKQEANDISKSSIAFRYKNISSDDAEIAKLNEAIIESIDKLYPEIVNADANFITYESIGATAAHDLLTKAGIAIAVSTLLILLYIIFRFTLVSGVAAIVTLLHDIAILFALTVICRVQINSSFVAAVITVIVYSINNTIIIFDRCRELMKPLKGKKGINYTEIGDTAVRANMRRSVYTTLTTLVTIAFLAIFGSESIRQFCVPIILGLLAGLYSSVFLATPLWSKMSYSYDITKAKYMTRNGVSYEKKVDEEIDLTVPRSADKDDDDDVFVGKTAKTIAPKGNKPIVKQIYKYKKKNTTFKKK